MSRILYVGDLHGNTNALGKIVMSADSKQDAVIVQVGDFGFGFPSKDWDKWLKKRANNKKSNFITPVYTCMGNHDNWTQLSQMQEEQGSDIVELYPGSKVYYVTRGTCIDIFGVKHLFIGGAESTDKYHRTEEETWWSKETPSKAEIERFYDALEDDKPDTVISHDAPLRVDLFRIGRSESYTPNALERCYELSSHHPTYHYFGHHHIKQSWKIQDTTFYCCGIEGHFWERNI